MSLAFKVQVIGVAPPERSMSSPVDLSVNWISDCQSA